MIYNFISEETEIEKTVINRCSITTEATAAEVSVLKIFVNFIGKHQCQICWSKFSDFSSIQFNPTSVV